MRVKCSFITNLVPRKLEKENNIRKVLKSEGKNVKNIGKANIFNLLFCYRWQQRICRGLKDHISINVKELTVDLIIMGVRKMVAKKK